MTAHRWDGQDRSGRFEPLKAATVATCWIVALGWASGVQAGEVRPPRDINSLSLDELADIEVTSVSKAPERLAEAPAAIYVITSEDIRRSGAASLPEVLRLAPNLEVAQQNVASYAITARGFNSPQAGNKLLVLIDGRSVYTPVASTVFWETQNVALADVERIEVVSGPGGTLWGSNAVNGVINIITQSASQTLGLFSQVTGGDRNRSVTMRYGSQIGAVASGRVYVTGFSRGDSTDRKPANATSDGTRGVQGGFRVDGSVARGAFTLQGDAYRNTMDLLDYRLTGSNLVARWARPFSAQTSLSLQAYYDRLDRRYLVADDLLRTLDFQAQLNTRLGEQHSVVLGGEFRAWRSRFYSKLPIGFSDPTANLSVGNVFVQDDIALTEDVQLTLGVKLEHSSYSGVEYLPNARLAWQPHRGGLLWAAASRAVRTPSRIDRELALLPALAPSPDFGSEKLTAFELGYRAQPLPQLALSVSTFYNVYDDLRTTELTGGKPPAMLRNGMRGETQGVEAWATYSPRAFWRRSAGFSALEKSLKVKPGHSDRSNRQAAGQDPPYQATLRSEVDLPGGVELDVAVRRVARVQPSNVPAYSEADARLGWWVTDRVELSLVGRNLLHESHLEVINTGTSPVTPIPRSVYLSLSLGF